MMDTDEIDAEAFLEAVHPNWESMCLQNPPGNTLGAALRAISDDTRSIFGVSQYSSEKAKARRWKSTYDGDYTPLAELRKEMARKGRKENDFKPKSAPNRDKVVVRESEHGAGRSASACTQRSMFTSWKIPPRLTSGGSRGGQDAELPKSCTVPSPLIRSKTELPFISGATPRPNLLNTPMPADMPVGLPPSSHGKSGRGTAKSMRTPMPAPSTAKPASYRKPKQLKSDQLLGRFYQPGQANTAVDFLQNATDPGSFAIKKALQQLAQDKNATVDRNLQKWLLSANQQDRDVALEFFQSLTDSKVLGEAEDQRDKIHNILSLLKHGKGSTKMASVHGGVHAQSVDEGRLHHVRLLTPHTRANKWMHQTWHHLPQYPDFDPVNNRSAIYTEPHKINSRHFVIHPDWG